MSSFSYENRSLQCDHLTCFEVVVRSQQEDLAIVLVLIVRKHIIGQLAA